MVQIKNLLLDKVVDEKKNQTYYLRHFSTTAVDQKWATDVSEFRTAAGKVYLSPILDMYTYEIISFSLSTKPDFVQTIEMLDKTFVKHLHLEGLIFHSDQGWQ